MVAWDDRWHWIGRHQIISKAVAWGLSNRRLVVLPSRHRVVVEASCPTDIRPAHIVLLTRLVGWRDLRVHFTKSWTLDDKVSRSEPDCLNFCSWVDLRLDVIYWARSYAETQILGQVEQEASLITFVLTCGCEVVTCEATDDVRLWLARIFTSPNWVFRRDIHENDALAIGFLRFTIAICEPLLHSLFFILYHILQLILVIFVRVGIIQLWPNVSIKDQIMWQVEEEQSFKDGYVFAGEDFTFLEVIHKVSAVLPLFLPLSVCETENTKDLTSEWLFDTGIDWTISFGLSCIE